MAWEENSCICLNMQLIAILSRIGVYLSENRLPMLSLIKQQIRQIGELLSNADDYLVQRNLFGNYCVAIPPELCLCYDMQAKQICRFEDSAFWSRVLAL